MGELNMAAVICRACYKHGVQYTLPEVVIDDIVWVLQQEDTIVSLIKKLPRAKRQEFVKKLAKEALEEMLSEVGK